MDGAKDAAEQVFGMGILLKLDQVMIELIQILVALNEKFFYDFIHRRLPMRTSRCGNIAVAELVMNSARVRYR